MTFRSKFFSAIFFMFILFQGRSTTIGQCSFQNPIMKGADPFAFFHEGNYYLLVTRTDRIGIKRSPKLQDIGPLSEITVWRFNDTPVGGHVWAPEMYYIDDNWYIYSCGQNTGLDSNPDMVPYIQERQEMFVLKSTTGDPFGPYEFYSWLMPGLGAIDETIFTHTDGKRYIIWSQFNIRGQPQSQCLYIAELNNPRSIGVKRVMISCPDQPWELYGWPVNEGAAVLQKEGKTYVAYSGSGYQVPEYALGYLVNSDGDLLNPGSWTKVGPVFQQNPEGGVYATGHNSFTTSPDGTEDWIVYHGRLSTDGNQPRYTFMQPFKWDGDMPVFGIPAPVEEYLNCPSDTGWIIFTETSRQKLVSVYPNPAGDYINIVLPEELNHANLKIINLIGQTFMDIDISDPLLNITQLPEGMYFINLTSGEKHYRGSFLKHCRNRSRCVF